MACICQYIQVEVHASYYKHYLVIAFSFRITLSFTLAVATWAKLLLQCYVALWKPAHALHHNKMERVVNVWRVLWNVCAIKECIWTTNCRYACFAYDWNDTNAYIWLCDCKSSFMSCLVMAHFSILSFYLHFEGS